MRDLLMEATSLLYQNKIEEGYQKVNEVLQDLVKWLNKESEEKVQEINQVLMQALVAMENGDAVLLADIFRFEILPRL